MDGEPRELQNPAQSAMGEERGDHERTPWLAKMCLDKHFLFYSILENIKCFRVIFQILWTLLCPLLKGPAPFGLILDERSTKTEQREFYTV